MMCKNIDILTLISYKNQEAKFDYRKTSVLIAVISKIKCHVRSAPWCGAAWQTGVHSHNASSDKDLAIEHHLYTPNKQTNKKQSTHKRLICEIPWVFQKE